MCRENESTVAIYALSARLVIALSTILIIYAISSAGLILKVPPMLLVGIFFVALYISCYFVDIHVHASEALMLCFLCENDVDTPYHNMNVCRESLKKAIADMDIKGDI